MTPKDEAISKAIGMIMSHATSNRMGFEQSERLAQLIRRSSDDPSLWTEIGDAVSFGVMSAIDQLAYLSEHELPRLYAEIFG